MHLRTHVSAIVATSALLSADDAGAQDGSADLVSADNPGFTNVTTTAPVLVLVTEQMVTASFPDGAETVTAPSLLARVGVTKWLEARAYLPSVVVRFPDDGDTQVDSDDLGLGAVVAGKLASKLRGSVVPVLVIPFIDDGAGAPGVEGRVQGNLSWSVTNQWTVEGAVQVGWIQQDTPTGTDARFRMVTGALVAFRPVHRVSLLAQSFVIKVEDQDWEPVVGGAAAYWITPGFMTFAQVNGGISDGSPPVTVTAGAVVRWW